MGPPLFAEISARYQTRVSTFNAGAGGLQRILQLNPRRFFVQFIPQAGGATFWPIVPGPLPSPFLFSGSVPYPITYKWHDCPSVVTGEFYAQTQFGTSLIIVECLYIGD